MSALKKSIQRIIFGAEEYTLPDTERDDYDSDIQESTGAPVERTNPLGYNLGYVGAFYTVIQGVIGTGIFLTPASILNSIGSVGASYVLWVTGFVIQLFEVAVYIEFITYFKRRSGGDVVYLEQAYPKPAFLVPTTFAAVSVVLSFLNSSAVAFGTYVLSAAEVEATTWRQRGIGVAALTSACIIASINSRQAIRLSNLLGFVKVVFLLTIVIVGIVTLSGATRVKDPLAAFKNSWEGTTSSGNAISNAIIKVSFSYGGSQYVFNLVGESHPRKTLKIFKYFIPGTLLFIFVLYILVITSYYAGAGSVEEIKNSNALIAAMFFQNVFRTRAATRAMSVFVALSAYGHLLTAVVGHSRALRECGRQGVLPYPSWWTSAKPLNTPLLPIFTIWLVNLIVMIAPPAGDAYNFIVDVGAYSGYIFKLLLVVGIIKVRKRRMISGLGYNGWKVPFPILVITILFELLVIAMAWVPPNDGSLIGSDVSFFYCTYAIVCIGLLGLCVLYYYIWDKVLPRIYNYEHRLERYELDNGEIGNRVIKVRIEDLEEWDLNHNQQDVSIEPAISSDNHSSKDNVLVDSSEVSRASNA